MQLTPRTLGIALGACMAGGLVVGIAMAIGPSVGTNDARQDAAGSSAAYSKAELGDAQVTYPTPSMRVAAPTSTPTLPAVASSSPLPKAKPTIASASSTPPPNEIPTAPEVTKTAGSWDKPQPTATRASTPIHPAPPPERVPKPKVNSIAVQRSAPEPLHDWKPPHLGVGVTDISAPALTSSARVHVTVMCSPSSACNASGTFLTITPEATHVSVTWSGLSIDRWRAWTTSSDYNAAPAG